MSIINAIVSLLASLLDKILPTLGISAEFIAKIDLAFSWFISLMQSASYFLPLDVFVICLGVMLVFDNWSLLFRVGQWVVKFIRG